MAGLPREGIPESWCYHREDPFLNAPKPDLVQRSRRKVFYLKVLIVKQAHGEDVLRRFTCIRCLEGKRRFRRCITQR